MWHGYGEGASVIGIVVNVYMCNSVILSHTPSLPASATEAEKAATQPPSSASSHTEPRAGDRWLNRNSGREVYQNMNIVISVSGKCLRHMYISIRIHSILSVLKTHPCVTRVRVLWVSECRRQQPGWAEGGHCRSQSGPRRGRDWAGAGDSGHLAAVEPRRQWLVIGERWHRADGAVTLTQWHSDTPASHHHLASLTPGAGAGDSEHPHSPGPEMRPAAAPGTFR